MSNPTKIATDSAMSSASSWMPPNKKHPLHQHAGTTTTATTATTYASDQSYLGCRRGPEGTFTITHRDVLEDYVVFPDVLGKGNYGCVRECMSRATGQALAIKTIDKAKIGRRDHLEREVALLQEVDHPNIMKMVDAYEDDDFVHIVTEKYDGGELFEKVINNTTVHGCIPEDVSARIIKSLLEAVEYLHNKDIVHRDIKPENMLLESNEKGAAVRLIDFGLSRKHRQDDAPMNNKVGTPYYTSPEVLKRGYNRACDLWSVGVVAYVLLSGIPPFNGHNDAEIHASIRKGRFDFEGPAWINISDDAKDFITRLLRRDPRRRLSAERALRHPWILENDIYYV